MQMANRYLKRCLTSQVSIKVHIKTKVKHASHPLGWLLLKKQQMTNFGEDVEEKQKNLVSFVVVRDACL